MDRGVREHVMPLADVKLGWWIKLFKGLRNLGRSPRELAPHTIDSRRR
jgi:hypothetical protein